MGVLALVAAVVAVALLGQGLMLLLARRVRDIVTDPAVQAVDSGLGLFAVLVTAMLVVWIVAGAVSTSGPRAARELVSHSAVVSALDRLMPSAADGLVEDLTQALDDGVFPRVFDSLGPEPIAPVDAPDGAVTKDPDVVRARWARWCTCGPSPRAADRPRWAAAGSWPAAGSPRTPTWWPAPTR